MNIGQLFASFSSLRPARWQRHPLLAGTRTEARTLLVTGATGFIGRHLCRHLIASGDRVIVLTRNRRRADDLYGPHVSVCTSLYEIESTTCIDAIVNLAGEPIFDRAWSKRRREVLIESRLDITQKLIDLIARLDRKPEVLISASAVGYYGVRGDEELTEAHRGQTVFQSQLCQVWELAAQRAEAYGVRVCRLRFGVVLGKDGGALPQQALAARCGACTVMGGGDQWLSWIHIKDAVRLIEHCVAHDAISGAVNATAPAPVRQHEFAKTLGEVFGPGLTLRVPANLLRFALGERAQLLVDGQRVIPMYAECSGFEFQYPQLGGALGDLYGQPAPEPADVLYDALCPVCDTEMRTYCRLATRNGRAWRFDDVSLRTDLIASYRLDLATARKRVYVLSKAGEMLSGMDALNAVWSGLPGWRVLAWVLRLPVVKPAAAAFYDFVLAPIIWHWNQRRRAIRATQEDGVLSGERIV
ncbi:hypothetical protein HNQ60_001660 [Povalibacter uvarum]|uniref:TIGR01777 family protein n=1 Tax=Povalibacter uvarum TaxID=732238 RepID=A0A841HKY2_9GAMM|nr:TIGR01777 family oxidoreductase [Povalibacter uvarum]MBB6092782.1 hypothetical protein [Povalibacter uvarum]